MALYNWALYRGFDCNLFANRATSNSRNTSGHFTDKVANETLSGKSVGDQHDIPYRKGRTCTSPYNAELAVAKVSVEGYDCV